MSSFVQDICGAVQAHAAEVPDKIFHTFLKDGQKTAFTFSDLWRRSGNFAAALLARGVGQGDIVIVSLPMGPDLVSGFLGAMRAGAIPSIMPYPNAKQKSDLFWAAHRTLFDRIDPSCFILSPAVAKLFAASLDHLVLRILVTDAVPDHQPAALAIDPGAIAFLQHSSGTTALKKGVKLTHSSVVSHVQTYARSCGIDGDSRIFSWLPLYHDMGLIACLIMPMVIGCTVTAMDNFEWVTRPTAMLEAITRDRLEFAWMPNFGFAHLVRSCPDPSKFDLSTLKALINCSEPCRPETHALFVSHFASAGFRPDALQVCYAMAENVFAVSQTTFGEPARQLAISMAAFDLGWARPAADGEPAMHIASCGAPLPEVNVSIVDDARVPLEAGRVGEVAIRTYCLFSGYNGRPDLTQRALVDGTYYTGDLGFMHDGELYLTGRKDDLILAYGRNLLAHELEAIVNKVEGVKPGRAVVFDVASEQLGSNVLIVMAEASPSVDVAELTRAIRAALDAGAGITPQQVILLREGDLLKTTSGKISRSANRTAYLAGQQEQAA